MKGNDRVIAALNDLLADEITAVSQYMVHAGMCANWGYDELHDANEKRAIEEMKHAEEIIDRILFFEATPIVTKINRVEIGANVEAQMHNDHASEEGAIKAYNEGIHLAVEMSDNGTRHLLEEILEDEEKHIDWLEAQIDQIKQMGIQTYLVEKVG